MRHLQITLYFLILWLCSTRLAFSLTCKENERNALIRFNLSLTADLTYNYRTRSGGIWEGVGWIGEDCCSWKGVECDNVTNNVIKIDLRSDIDVTYPIVFGEVNSSLLELKYLRYLDLSCNIVNTIPSFFGSMTQLRYLNLSNSRFVGKVPHTLGNLTKLVALDLNSVYTDTFPYIDNLEWASNLVNLQYLDLSGVDMSQALDSSLNVLHKLPSLLVLNMVLSRLGGSHLDIRNSNVSSSPLQHLDLHYNALSGSFPSFIRNLSSLRFLDLSLNGFDSSIPSWLGNGMDLEYLSLSYNSFSGSFPRSIQNSSCLTSLDLSYNQLNSSIPSWLSDQRCLEYIDLSMNRFDHVVGGIMNTIGRLCSLKHLDLSQNQIEEEISESYANFISCTKYDIEFLSLSNNYISNHLPIDSSHIDSETFPQSMGGLSSWVHLNLSHNRFTSVFSFVESLVSLQVLDLSYNKLSVVHQVSLNNLSSLSYLDMSSNSLVLDLSSGWLPPFQLEHLYILPCKLNTPFPKWLLTQEKISELDLSDTMISGPLPNNIGNAMKSLSNLKLASNHINGSIPISLCELENLEFLNLKKNRLSGMIPDCWGNSKIHGVELSSNRLSGQIPISFLSCSNLELLSLGNNSLYGELPFALSNLNMLVLLDVGKNNLHGVIPTWDSSYFPYLQILILRENKFNGTIPSQLCSIDTLKVVDLASNDLVGTIPPCLGQFKGMGSSSREKDGMIPIRPRRTKVGSYISYKYLSPNRTKIQHDEWSAVEVMKGAKREYTTILYLLVNMDLSCNKLEGEIPEEMTGLSLLVSLNLSYNHLTGIIPKEIGMLQSLESLDLSCNNIFGSIPKSMSYLHFLSQMNLSFNNLQGQIPTGNQLQVLDDPSIYMGNPRLCGDPLPKKCFYDNIAHPPTTTTLEEDIKHEKMWFYLVIIAGFATGFWGVIGILVVKKRWRYAYFQLAEELADWLFIKVALTIARVKGGR